MIKGDGLATIVRGFSPAKTCNGFNSLSLLSRPNRCTGDWLKRHWILCTTDGHRAGESFHSDYRARQARSTSLQRRPSLPLAQGQYVVVSDAVKWGLWSVSNKFMQANEAIHLDSAVLASSLPSVVRSYNQQYPLKSSLICRWYIKSLLLDFHMNRKYIWSTSLLCCPCNAECNGSGTFHLLWKQGSVYTWRQTSSHTVSCPSSKKFPVFFLMFPCSAYVLPRHNVLLPRSLIWACSRHLVSKSNRAFS